MPSSRSKTSKYTLGSARKYDKTKKVIFTEKRASVKVIFDLIPSTLGSKSRGALLKFVMRDSYIKLRIVPGLVPLWLQVKEQKRDLNQGIANLEPVFSTSDKDNIFKLNKFSLQIVGATNYILSTKETIIRYLEQHLIEFDRMDGPSKNSFDKYHDNISALNNLLTETEFTLECFFKLQELCYNRLLEYPSPNVAYNTLDETVLQTLKQQDFIQIMLRYMISLFGTVESLYEFNSMRKLNQNLIEETGSAPAGQIKQIVVPSNQNLDSGLQIGSPKFPQQLMHLLQPELGKLGMEEVQQPEAVTSGGAKPIKAPIMTHQDILKIDIQMKKRDVLLMCYKILHAMSRENENLKQFLSQYIHLMQMQSYFFPEIIDEITQMFSTNQEILLKLKKKTFNKQLIFIGGSGLNKTTGFQAIELPQLNEEIHHLLLEFYEAEGIKTSGRNFFFFYCYYLLNTDSLEVRQKILRLFTAVSVFEDQGINSNQEEIYSQIKSSFKEMFRNQFYSMNSRGQDLMIVNPKTLKTERLQDIFAVTKHKKGVKDSAGVYSTEKGRDDEKSERKGFFRGLEDFGKKLPTLKIGEWFGGNKANDREVPAPMKSPLPSQPNMDSQPNLAPRAVESNKVSVPSGHATPRTGKQRGFNAGKLSSAAMLSRHDSSDQEDLETMKHEREHKEREIDRLPLEEMPAVTEEERNQFTEHQQEQEGSEHSDQSYEDALNTGGLGEHLLSETAKRARLRAMKFTAEQKLFILIQLQFYAGMCLDRNYIWKGYLEQKGYFNFDAVLSNLRYRFEEPLVSSALARLLHHMYVDQKPMYKVIVPQYSKIVASGNEGVSPGESYPPSGVQSPTALRNSTAARLVGPQGTRRPVGFNLESIPPHPRTKQLQETLLSFVAELKATLKSLPRKLSELQSEEAYDRFEECQKKLSNELVLEMFRLVHTAFEFGYYTIEVLPSQKHYLPVQMLESYPESDLTPVLRVMIKLMEFEPEIPEIRLLLKSLRTTLKEARLNNEEGSKAKFEAKLRKFKFSEQYDKMAIVEDVENKEDEAFTQYEAYFRQYLSKDITFKEHFNYRNKILEQIKLKVMKVIHASIDFITEGYANKVVELFKNTVQQAGLDRDVLVTARSLKSEHNKGKYEAVFKEAIQKALEEITPGISLTGVSLDVLLEVLSQKTLPKNLDINSVLGPSLFPSLILLFTFNQESDLMSSSCIELLIKIFSLRLQVVRIVQEVMIIQGEDGFKVHHKMRKYQRELKDLCDESENWIRSQTAGLRERKLERVLKYLDWMCQQLSGAAEENLGNPHVLECKEFNIDPRVQDALRNLKVHEIAVDFIRDTFYILNESYEDATDPLVIKYFTGVFLFLIKFVHKNKRNQLLLSKEIPVFLQESKIDVGQVSLIIEIYRDNLQLCKQNHEIVTDDFIRWILNYGRRERFLDFFIGLMKCDGAFLIENQRKILSLFLDHPRKLDLLFICSPNAESKGSHYLMFEPRTDTQNRFYFDEPYKYHSKMLQLLCYACVGKSGVFVNEIKVRDLFEFSYLLEILETEDSFTSTANVPRTGMANLESNDSDDKKPEWTSSPNPPVAESGWSLPPINKGGANSYKKNITLQKVPEFHNDVRISEPLSLMVRSGAQTPHGELVAKQTAQPKVGLGSKLYQIGPINKHVTLNAFAQNLKRMDSQEAFEIQRCVKLDVKNARNQLKCAVAELMYYVYFESNSVARELIILKPRLLKFFQKETERIQAVSESQITPIYTEFLFRHLLRLAAGVAATLSEDEETNVGEAKETLGSPVNNTYKFNTQETEKQVSKVDLAQEQKAEFNIKEDFINTFANKLRTFGLDIATKYRKELQAASTYFQFDFGTTNNSLIEAIGSEAKQLDGVVLNLSEAWVYLWKVFKSTYATHEKVQEKIVEEKKVLSHSLNQIEDILKIPLINNPQLEPELRPILILVNKKKVIKSIIDFLQENTKQSDRRHVLVEVLFCLAGMIPLDDEGTTNSQNLDAVIKEQEFLAECGAIEMIMKQLTDPLLPLQADDFTFNLLLFAIRMLEGGNTKIQQEFYNFMVNEPSSEVLFLKIYEIFVKEQEFLTNGLESPNTALVRSILEFFQHLAEGHFQDLQLYIRLQTNSLRSFNFLEETVSLLSAYVTANQSQYFASIISACDTITELIQGPCFDNQKVLMQGRMMETVAKILSLDEFSQTEALRRKILLSLPPTSLQPWMVARIKHKVSVALVSLVECRKDDIILNKMYTSLKKYILDNITSFYLGFVELYGEELDEKAFQNLEMELPEGQADEFAESATQVRTEDDKLLKKMVNSQLESTVIVQTAFNFYVILRKKQESDERDDDESIEVTPETENPLDIFSKKLLQTQELEEIEQEINPQTPDELKRYMERIRSKNSQTALDFMKKKTRTIEVVRQDEELEVVYFLTEPYFEAINNEIKDEFNQEVTRVSCKTKCNDLLEKSSELIEKLKRERVIMRHPVLKHIHWAHYGLKVTSFLLILVINILTVVFYTQSKDEDISDTSGTPTPKDTTPRWVYSTQLVLGILVAAHGATIFTFDVYRELPVLKTVAKNSGTLEGVRYFFAERTNIAYYAFYTALAVVGWFIPGWYTFLLNDILNINSILKNIVRSVWRPRTSLILTLILFIIVLYAFSSIGFVYFSQAYANSMPDQRLCRTIFECFLLTFDKGMKFDGAIGNYLKMNNEDKLTTTDRVPVDLGRFAYENLLLIFDFIIILNIVTGIIIDTFGSLREEYNAYIEDSETFCFICGYSVEDIEKEADEGQNFEYHVKQEHYQWNYLFYIGYIKDKKSTELTGLESYICDLIKQEEISWFPNHRAMMIQENKGLNPSDAVDEAIKQIQADVDLLVTLRRRSWRDWPSRPKRLW